MEKLAAVRAIYLRDGGPHPAAGEFICQRTDVTWCAAGQKGNVSRKFPS